MKIPAFVILSFFCLSLAGQAPAYDDLVMEADSTTKAYQPTNKNFAFIRAKRGTGGVTKTSKGDSVRTLPITDIVLVFSEITPSSITNRETNNRERWENLIKTYPEFFQDNTNYISICQCKIGGDTSTFRPAQGFYVYFAGKEEPKAEAPKVESKKPAKETASAEKPKEKVKEDRKAEKTKKEEKAEKEEKPVKAEKSKKKDKPEKEAVASKKEEAPVVAEPETKTEKPKKEGYSTPKRSKDTKACRPPCYENGDEDLFTFFKDNLPLSKKQKKNSKDLVVVLRLQLNFDGSIKKPFVQGLDEELNQQVLNAVKNMNNWNPAVKGGVTVKSEVKMTLKYDKSTKAMRPFETTIIPRPGPKCTCVPDSQIFGE